MIILSMIETTSRGSFNLDQTKHLQRGEEASTQKTLNWSYDEAKVLVEIWADEEIQRQLPVPKFKWGLVTNFLI